MNLYVNSPSSYIVPSSVEIYQFPERSAFLMNSSNDSMHPRVLNINTNLMEQYNTYMKFVDK